MNVNLVLCREDDEINVSAECKYYAGCRGARDSLCGVAGAGPALEPDSPPEIEILKTINTDTGAEIELTEEEVEKVIEAAFEKLADEASDVPEPDYEEPADPSWM